jgi:ketosteroid isomerase-like protein
VTTEADLQRLVSEHACERLVYEYARLVDSGRASRIPDLFTDDAVWTGADGRSMNGRAELVSGFSGREALARRQSRHVITNVIVDVGDDEGATGIAYLINYRHDAAEGVAENPAPAGHPKFVGDYHLSFRCVGGKWRIASLRFDLAFLRRRGDRPD